MTGIVMAAALGGIDVTGIILAAVVVGGTGIFIGFFLGVAGEKFKVEVDPREEEIGGVLPGNNCGGCGYAGCSGLAAAIVAGEAPVNACPVGGASVGDKIASIMGVDAGGAQQMTAYVRCGGTCEKAKKDYEYFGEEDCAMAGFVPGGGPKSCNYGCLGFGNCVKACPFDAIHIVDGIALVDKEACKACSKCVAACPKNLIELIPYEAKHAVSCMSLDKGKAVMDACSVGCIGCRICEKNCPENAITITDNVAHIDQEKCTRCGVCAGKCPKKTISIF
jgi:Na+-translocating ferredoxin:NAD+ oxidoreductase RNF subunit RnfB